MTSWSLLGLGSVAFVVVRDLSTRRFSRGLPSTTGAIWAAAAVTVLGLIGITQDGWQPVTLLAGIEIAGAALFLTVGYICAIMVMRVGEIGVVAPFRYTSLLLAIILGWLLFGTLPDRWTLLGGAIVVASGIYMLWRERVKRLRSCDHGGCREPEATLRARRFHPLLTSRATPPRSRLPCAGVCPWRGV